MQKLEILELTIDKKSEDSTYAYDFSKAIIDCEKEESDLSFSGDKLDLFLAASSGLICSALDSLFNEEFDLSKYKNLAKDNVEKTVVKIANILSEKELDLKESVAFLENNYGIPSDNNLNDFGGPKQHHLKDFAHHPTILGLIFSMLTQFTECAYGTDVNGNFITVPINKESLKYIGSNFSEKIYNGVIVWFFHLVSDMAGSRNSVCTSGGTGIPGPILSFAKEFSSLPIFKYDEKNRGASLLISKFFNGTFFVDRDEQKKMIPGTSIGFDLRAEIGLGMAIIDEAKSVVLNEAIVRAFYSLHSLYREIEKNKEKGIEIFKNINFSKVLPKNNPTLSRMLVISTGVFTTVDVADAVATGNVFLNINYIGIARFSIAINSEISWLLKRHDVINIRKKYQEAEYFLLTKSKLKSYERIGRNMDAEKFELTVEQIEILYNLEMFKTVNDIYNTKTVVNQVELIKLKEKWLAEWQQYMEMGFPSFVGEKDAILHWYNKEELYKRIEENLSTKVWFKLALLETMIFKPYFCLKFDKDEKGKIIPDKEYNRIQGSSTVGGYNSKIGNIYLENEFSSKYLEEGFIKRIKTCYDKAIKELSEVTKTVLISASITAVITLACVAVAGVFAPVIAQALVGSSFSGLSGAALSNAALAYLGGGAIAAGGHGIAGGTMLIVGGGGLLGFGIGAGVSSPAAILTLANKKNMILNSAKLMVSIKEIFINDENDIEYSNSIYEQYSLKIVEGEKTLLDLQTKMNTANEEEKKQLKKTIEEVEGSLKAMEIAKKNIQKFISSYQIGMETK